MENPERKYSGPPESPSSGGGQVVPGEAPASDSGVSPGKVREEIRCDLCGQSFPAQYLRTGRALVAEGQVACPLCRLRKERKVKNRIDFQLVVSAVLLFVVFPLLVSLLLTHWEPEAEPAVSDTDVLDVGFAERMEARLERLEILLQAASRQKHEGAIQRLEERIASLEAGRENLAPSGTAPSRTGRSSTEKRSELSSQRLRKALTQRFETVLATGSGVDRLEVLAQMARLKDPEHVRLILDLLERDDEIVVRTVAAEVLGVFGDPVALPALRALSGTNDLLLRHAVEHAVSRIEKRVNAEAKVPESKSSGDRGTR